VKFFTSLPLPAGILYLHTSTTLLSHIWHQRVPNTNLPSCEQQRQARRFCVFIIAFDGARHVCVLRRAFVLVTLPSTVAFGALVFIVRLQAAAGICCGLIGIICCARISTFGCAHASARRMLDGGLDAARCSRRLAHNRVSFARA